MAKVSSEFPIDIVIPWVDGTDVEWQKEKNKYSSNSNNNEGINDARFRDWDNLKYVFRSIEKNMPWINNIFFITYGHVPKWLNTNNSKLKIISHNDFIPKEYLPTFSSHTIELNIHRIKELSDHFIYFNDDIFVTKPITKDVFFKNGKPCDSLVLNIHCPQKGLMIHQIALNDVSLINANFQKQNIRLYNNKYGIVNNMLNLILSRWPRLPGFRQFHMANAYLKSSFEIVWNTEFEELDKTCRHKFREITDINQWVIREWQLVSNNFYPTNKCKIGSMIDFEKESFEDIKVKLPKIFNNNKIKMICINDGDTIENYNVIKNYINNILEENYPKKSSFEVDYEKD